MGQAFWIWWYFNHETVFVERSKPARLRTRQPRLREGDASVPVTYYAAAKWKRGVGDKDYACYIAPILPQTNLNPTRRPHLPPELSQLINPNPCLYYYLKSIQENLHKFAQFDKKKSRSKICWWLNFATTTKPSATLVVTPPLKKVTGDRWWQDRGCVAAIFLLVSFPSL